MWFSFKRGLGAYTYRNRYIQIYKYSFDRHEYNFDLYKFKSIIVKLSLEKRLLQLRSKFEVNTKEFFSLSITLSTKQRYQITVRDTKTS